MGIGFKKFSFNSIETLAFIKTLLWNLHALPNIKSSKDTQNDELFIIANAPSLQQDIKGFEEFLAQKDVLMLNNSILQPIFETLKPKYYVLMDSAYFVGNAYQVTSDRTFASQKEIFEKTLDTLKHTNHTLTLFIPSIWKDKLKICNPNITLQTYGVFKFEGFRWLQKFLFSRAFAVPSHSCVLIPSIICALRLGYKKIYLLGCEQSAFKGYEVDCNNTLRMEYKHFYKEKDTSYELERTNIADSLYADSEVFRSYRIINDLFTNRIVNCASVSYIDAFPRVSLAKVLGGGAIEI
ncbi:hypothetical protein CQA49_00290 [Helicobacter sp. MIT 00-7814]|uniref:hypothetical protein n=1 Tax=unclassified Helicobacter TaxID=2593540 RepID=UPI000E1E803D|nr:MULTISPECIES: hypothetical protein [unclassified Helicobacter]RDU57140.1 hypothetical protein CQA49_00290 [Helicobacter sp. MIT 00-7814]RDU57692.1 hypothetical protein CQA37_00290 [Helicobacter sp. MIT 99-10781]